MLKPVRILVAAISLFFAIKSHSQPNQDYSVLQTRPHQDYIFTQGLVHQDKLIYESSGRFKKSFLRVYDPHTGEIIRQKRLPAKIFAEGLAKVNNHLYLLTWKAETLYVLNAANLKTEVTLDYQGEGWGLTHDGEDFYMSDGKDRLFVRDTKTFAIKNTLSIRGHSGIRPLRLNELEYSEGYIWANSWQDTKIFKIHPTTGQIENTFELQTLVSENNHSQGHSVLNGIAYDKIEQAFWVTGKLWPNMYLLKFNDTPQKHDLSEK